MSKIENKANDVSRPAQVNRSQIEHRATWMALIYDEMLKAGVADAEAIVRRAIRRCGNFHGEGFRASCKDAADLREFKAVFLNDVGMETFSMEPAATRDDLSIDFHYCPLCSAWAKLKLDDERIALLCDMAMDGDRGIAEAMGLNLELTDKIADGCKACHLRFSAQK